MPGIINTIKQAFIFIFNCCGNYDNNLDQNEGPPPRPLSQGATAQCQEEAGTANNVDHPPNTTTATTTTTTSPPPQEIPISNKMAHDDTTPYHIVSDTEEPQTSPDQSKALNDHSINKTRSNFIEQDMNVLKNKYDSDSGDTSQHYDHYTDAANKNEDTGSFSISNEDEMNEGESFKTEELGEYEYEDKFKQWNPDEKEIEQRFKQTKWDKGSNFENKVPDYIWNNVHEPVTKEWKRNLDQVKPIDNYKVSPAR
ncbi:uncharacterized protein BX663DRAFT_526498 [Cokeromyces recurvatus]|uniref:uncharacterized protein n=1 Tax=Cokeromyces recurvatus TaxID=90255 RepID=UPI00221F6D6F|nr:uncharacterized protein BX663DRAFT_526498 [Cokeromyces recurvatus]KAI7897934.1 hypothetical protein BX663DRAFT_526498 [Cokeromyces recurvatus]